MVVAFSLVVAACGGSNSSDAGGTSTTASSSSDAGAVDATTTTSLASSEDDTVCADQIDPIELKVMSFGGEDYPIRVMLEDLMARVEGELGDSISFDYYPAESLVRLVDAFDGVRDRIVDIGMTSAAYEPDRMGLVAAVANMPWNWDLEAFADVYREDDHFYDWVQEFWNENDLQMLSWTNVPAGEILSSTPVHTLEDMNGLLVRSVSSAFPGLRAMGAEPVDIPTAELYTALQRGTVDAATISVNAAVSNAYYEVAPYLVLSNFYTGSLPVIMNKEVYDGLPDCVRDIFDSSILAAEEQYYGNVVEEYERDLAILEELPEVEVYELPADELARWQDAVKPTEEELAAQFPEEWETFSQLRAEMQS